MNFFRFFYLLTIIKNNNLPICKNCIYFIQYKHQNQGHLDRCAYFGEKNIISGEINYDFADHCRLDENRCGINATYFQKK